MSSLSRYFPGRNGRLSFHRLVYTDPFPDFSRFEKGEKITTEEKITPVDEAEYRLTSLTI